MSYKQEEYLNDCWAIDLSFKKNHQFAYYDLEVDKQFYSYLFIYLEMYLVRCLCWDQYCKLLANSKGDEGVSCVEKSFSNISSFHSTWVCVSDLWLMSILPCRLFIGYFIRWRAIISNLVFSLFLHSCGLEIEFGLKFARWLCFSYIHSCFYTGNSTSSSMRTLT